jgi:hypothetical protein
VNQRNLLPGLLLIGLGVFFLVGRNTNLGGWIFLAGLGAIFLVAYFNSRSYGLLIPGCILLGLGLGEAMDQSSLGLGLGFIGIFAVDTLVRGRMSHWWPLIPGVIIAGSELSDMNIAGLGTLRDIAADWWPLLLVLLGVLILFRGMADRRA